MPEPRFDVTTLGEMLLRLSVPPGERLENARQLNVNPAGGMQMSSRCLLVWKEKQVGQARCQPMLSDGGPAMPCAVRAWRQAKSFGTIMGG